MGARWTKDGVVMADLKSNWKAEMTALADKAAAELQGTCNALYDLGEEYEAAENDQTFCDVLDSQVFCCDNCGWWCEQSEMANRKDEAWICEDCTDDSELIED